MADLVESFVVMTSCKKPVAVRFLNEANWDINRALNSFFEEMKKAPQYDWTVFSDISQYSFKGGRSACTFIALHAINTIERIVVANKRPAPSVIGSIVREAATIFEQDLSSLGHCAGEELLACVPILSSKLHKKGIQQYSLSNDGTSFMSILRAATKELRKNEAKTVNIVLTKPPETVLLVAAGGSSPGSECFYIFDSHPRNLKSIALNGAHLIKFSSAEDLCKHLCLVFPYVDLGSDVLPSASLMYNAFDALSVAASSTVITKSAPGSAASRLTDSSCDDSTGSKCKSKNSSTSSDGDSTKNPGEHDFVGVIGLATDEA